MWNGVQPFCIVQYKLMICIQTYAAHAAMSEHIIRVVVCSGYTGSASMLARLVELLS